MKNATWEPPPNRGEGHLNSLNGGPDACSSFQKTNIPGDDRLYYRRLEAIYALGRIGKEAETAIPTIRKFLDIGKYTRAAETSIDDIKNGPKPVRLRKG